MSLKKRIMALLNELPNSFTVPAIKRICAGDISPRSAMASVKAALLRLEKTNMVRKEQRESEGNIKMWWRSAKWDAKIKATLGLDQAKELLERGSTFGDVCPLLSPEDQETLRYWFVRAENIPRLSMCKSPHTSGNRCKKCGSNLVSVGEDQICQECGQNDDWKNNVGSWGLLDKEPCRFCHHIGKVYFRADDSPLDRNTSQVVRCDNCGRNWEVDSTTA